MEKFGIGQPVRRVEDPRLVAGRGRFVDDIDLPRQCHGAVLYSPHAHALIRGIDISGALAAPGVVCVLTGADAAADKLGPLPTRLAPEALGNYPKAYRALRPVLVRDRVRCIGDRVAFVVAETAAQARDAAELIEVDYEQLPAVIDIEAAVRDDAPKVWDDCPGNVAARLWYGDEKATDAAFAGAKHVVFIRLEANRISANTLEPRGSLGDYNALDDAYTLYHSSQNPHGARAILALDVFGIPETRMRVVTYDVGGGFGMKSAAYPEDALVLWGSKRCGRPVKWTCTRSEALMGDSHARDQVVHGEMAVDADGRILAIRARALQAVGAYGTGTLAPIEFSLRLIPNVYDVQIVHLATQGVLTHTSPLTSYRGAGRPEAVTLVERLLDRAALKVGIDPAEIRRRNFIRPEAMPYKTATGHCYDGGDFAGVLERCLELSDWKGFDVRRAAARTRGRLRGRAVTFYIEVGGRMNERMELRCDTGGTVTIVAGTHSHGQGHATTYAQMVNEWLGVPFDSIRFVQGDTDQVPFGRGSFAARASLVGGCALKVASDVMVEKAKLMAAYLMEAAATDIQFKGGRFAIAGTDRSLPFPEVAKAFYRPSLPKGRGLGVGLESSGTWEPDPPNYPNGCHVCEVEIDPETGALTLERYTVVDDLGRVINPMICEGQIHGGLAQGIGQALMEQIVYDRESGQLLTGSFTDYCMPRADDLCAFAVDYVEIPCSTNPLGLKGVGEAGAVGSPPTITNAIVDALRPLGVDHVEMPATPWRIWDSIHRAKAESAR
jgi:carbon-monoxide dehydrogenase large subunit